MQACHGSNHLHRQDACRNAWAGETGVNVRPVIRQFGTERCQLAPAHIVPGGARDDTTSHRFVMVPPLSRWQDSHPAAMSPKVATGV